MRYLPLYTLTTAAGLLALMVPLSTGTASAAAANTVVGTTAAPMPSTDGRVEALAYANGLLYSAGAFTGMTFRGVPYARNHLAAMNSATGRPTAFNPNVDGDIDTLALSPDKSILYVGGSFSHVGTTPRTNVAAISTATGALTSFAPVVNGTVKTIAATSGAVYIGGTVTAVNGSRRAYAAAVDTSGVLLPWAPILDGWVRALLVAPDGSRIFLGGGFSTVNGKAFHALGSVDPVTAANEPFHNGLVPTYVKTGLISQATSLATDGTSIFVGAEGTGRGAFDGTLAFRPADGTLVWRNTCLGATQAVLYLAGVVYKASHAHDCSSAGGFGPITAGWQPHHLLAQSPTGGRLLQWGTTTQATSNPLPDTNGGTDDQLGPLALATDGTQLFVGGEFTTVNNAAQQGLGRFHR